MLLDVRLERVIVERFGRLNELQEKSVDAVLSGRDVLIMAPVGFGKTEAAMIPVFDRLLKYKEKKDDKGINALYITPLRSLNRDMMERLEQWANRLGISIDVRHGDTPQARRARQSRLPPQLMITTPETFTGMLSAKRLRLALSYCKHVIIDELHSIIDNKRGMQLALSLERLDALTGGTQRIGLSATIGTPEIALRYLSPPPRQSVVVEVNRRKSMEITVEHPSPVKTAGSERELDLDPEAMGRLLRVKELIDKGKTLIFVNTRQVAEALGSRLLLLKANVAVHHGSLARQVRVRVENEFKKNKVNALIATSSLELGIDIGDVNHVIQYMSPRQASRLIQRVGRSGHRMELVPKGTLIVSDIDDTLESLAIVKLVEEGWMEPTVMERNAYDVIAHQLVGVLLERGTVKLEEVHALFSKSSVYDIGFGELIEIAEQLAKQRIVYINRDDNTLHKTLSTRIYYYTHLSTIPKTRRFKVRDVERNRYVSTLDEGFVATLNPGDTFITRGLPWRVVDITRDEVLVEASDDFSLSLPDWEGEEIPVPSEVALRATSLRRELAGKGFVRWRKFFKGKLDLPEEEVVPDDRTIVIESYADLTVVHLPFGSLINATFASLFGQIIGKDRSVRVMHDPYRVVIQTNSPLVPDDIEKVLMNTDPEDVLPVIVNGLEESRLFAYKFNHVAQNFGMVGEDETVSKKLIKYMRGLPVYRETVRVLLKDYFDVNGTVEMLRRIQNGEFKIVKRTGSLSEWAKMGLIRIHGGEFVMPTEPHSEIVESFLNHILDTVVKLKCTYCNKFWLTKIKDLDENGPIRCPVCGSEMVGYAGVIKNGRFYDKDKRFIDMSVPLVQAYGRRALIALTVYGVGIETAKKILRKVHRDETNLALDLLNAQKQFIKTKRFWKL